MALRKRRLGLYQRAGPEQLLNLLLLREVVWVILDQFRTAVFFCCCRCGHVGNALALSIMSTAVLDVGAVEL